MLLYFFEKLFFSNIYFSHKTFPFFYKLYFPLNLFIYQTLFPLNISNNINRKDYLFFSYFDFGSKNFLFYLPSHMFKIYFWIIIPWNIISCSIDVLTRSILHLINWWIHYMIWCVHHRCSRLQSISSLL